MDGRDNFREMAYSGRDDEYFVYNALGHLISPNTRYMAPSHYEEPSQQKAPGSTPSGSLHQRGWSDSTLSTNLSSGKPFLPSISNVSKSKKSRPLLSIGGSWVQEIVALAIALGAVGSIMGVLAKFDGRALPSWPYAITLNALIAVLAAVTVAAMNVPLQNSMSQLKWIRFNQSRARLSDMDAFDEASRGTWGAIKLLFTLRGGFLGSVGAIVSVTALLLGAFAQQIVTYTLRDVVNPTGASVNRALNYTGALPGTTSPTGFVPILPLKSAVYSGLFAENNRPTAALAFECQGGNCTWDHYDTLGVCAECVDLSPFVEEFCGDPQDAGNCGWQVPQGAKLADDTVVFSMTPQIPTARGDQAHSTLVRLLFMGTEAHDGIAGEMQPWARQCTLSACLQTLETRVARAVLAERSVSATINRTVLDNTDLDDGRDHDVYVAGDDGTAYRLGIEAMLGIRGWFSTLFAAGSASRNAEAFNRTIAGGGGGTVVNLTVGISSGETFFDSDTVTAFYWNYYEYPDGIDMLVNDVATSMTVAFRSFPVGAEPVAGRAVFTESYVRVRWGFAVVPILVVVGTALFLVAAILQSERTATDVWKSSALAPLLHGLDETAKGQFALTRGLKEQRAQSRVTKVRLEESDDGTLLRL